MGCSVASSPATLYPAATVRADIVVNACGAWCAALADTVGLALPVDLNHRGPIIGTDQQHAAARFTLSKNRQLAIEFQDGAAVGQPFDDNFNGPYCRRSGHQCHQ